MDSSTDQVAKIRSCEVRDEVLSLSLNLGPIWLDYELGVGRGGLIDTVHCVSIGPHFDPPPPLHAYTRPSWILSSAPLLDASKGFPVLMTRVGEAPSIAQSWPITAGL